MAVTKRYKVYCRGKLIGEYTAVDVADMLKCTPGTVRSYASRGLKLYGKYTFEVVVTEPLSKAAKLLSNCDEWSQEWERTRQQLLSSGVDLGQIKIRPKSVWR